MQTTASINLAGEKTSSDGQSFFSMIAGWLKRQRSYRITVRELSKLSSRELNDLGISRGDIHHVAKKASQDFRR